MWYSRHTKHTNPNGAAWKPPALTAHALAARHHIATSAHYSAAISQNTTGHLSATPSWREESSPVRMHRKELPPGGTFKPADQKLLQATDGADRRTLARKQTDLPPPARSPTSCHVGHAYLLVVLRC